MLLGIHLGNCALFCLLGFLFSKGKCAWLIAGYNTASPSKKAQMDEQKPCHFMGKLLYGLSLCWLVVASSEIFHTMVLLWVGLGLFLVVLIAGLVYANTGNRFAR